MSNPLSTQTNPNLNSNGNLEKPINSNNTDNLEDVHLTMAIPKSEEFATLWRTSELHVKNKDILVELCFNSCDSFPRVA